ncbi:aspartic proteinase CDR1-like [Punica granatum]|uniref:Aspartic proteinase CDR1-like n=1 Tax=Punica granatum TaxID=22663 RepID=A0A6P8D506_PUNGR|nr:aspartic proteinase CDR1-like [Punica granatum]
MASLLTIIFCSVFVFGLSSPLSVAVPDGGFSVELIHRDSPRSPLYDPAATQDQRLRNALARSLSRATRLCQTDTLHIAVEEPAAEIFSNNGEYLMNISIGTPPVKIVGVMDTGSDLFWTQCMPCDGCYEQINPLFDPQESSSYRDLPCTSSKCKLLPQTGCDHVRGQICQYHYSYGDKSFTNGNIATETVTLNSISGQPISFPHTLFGCGHHNRGTFGDKTSGIIGLGGGAISLVSQMGETAGGKFSYCLVPLSQSEKSSQLNFGSRAEVTGPGAVSTPLVQKSPKTFYHITLEGVSVGSSRFEFSDLDSPTSKRNIVIDSGTTLTLLPEDLYKAIETALVKLIKLEKASDPLDILNLCFKTVEDTEFEAPNITFHFTGADVKLGTLNTFIRVAEDVVCLSFKPSDVDVSLFGNIAQMNFLVGYDTQERSISFMPTDCSNLQDTL